MNAETKTRPHDSVGAIPKTMRAVAIDRFGGPEVLKLHILPVPEINANEVLIALDSSGVGSWDAEMRAGWWPEGKPEFPLILGADGAGIVAAAGSRIRRFKPGDRVYCYSFANPKGGFYAEYVAVLSDNVGHLPQSLDLFRAGAVATTGLTALQGIDDVLGLKRDEAVIVHGASGGVGTLAVQFAKLHGARVLATASGDDGVALARDLGADAAIDGRHADIAAAARDFAEGGVDAVLALVGKALEHCIDGVRRGGRVAYPNGVEPEPKSRPGISITPYDAIAGTQEFESLNRAIDAARLKVPIAASYPLADAAKAHERLAAGHVLGKIVLRIAGEVG